MDALEFLNKSSKSRRQPIYVLTGDEDFLKRRVMEKLQPMIIGESDPSFAVSNYPGDKAEFSTIRNELDTIPFLSDCRLVIVDQADPFVSKFRAQLEKYCASPAKSGVLILNVKSWPSNTKLAKLLPEAATLTCKAPAAYKLPAWCIEWTKSQYQKTLAKPAAELLVELVGAQMGVLDQELKKLSDFVGEETGIQAKEVDLLVGRSRSANVFKIMDAIGNGKPAEALNILSELLVEGEEP
jgi:DNA polymerase III subunit delta